MNPIMLRFIQFVLVVMIFGNIECDQLTLDPIEDDHHRNQTIGCTAVCMRDKSDFGLSDCYKECMNSSTSLLPSVVETNSNETFRLLCRDADAIVIEVKSDNKHDVRELFVVQKVENGEPATVISDSAHVRLGNLKVNSTYNVSVSIFNAIQDRRLPGVKCMSTWHDEVDEPLAVPQDSIRIVDFAVNENPHFLDAYIEWSPADDMVCTYILMLYETVENIKNSKHRSQTFIVVESTKLYRYPVHHLVLNSEYRLSIGSLNMFLEGPYSEINFATPTYSELHNSNMSLRPPQLLVNLTSTQELVANNVYNINVTWNWIRPKHRPMNYSVSIHSYYLSLNDTGSRYEMSTITITMNVSGDQCSAYFHNILVASPSYDIQVRAYTMNGSVVTNATHSFKNDYYISLGNQEQSKDGIRMYWIVLPLLLLLLMALIVLALIALRPRIKGNIVEHPENVLGKVVYSKTTSNRMTNVNS